MSLTTVCRSLRWMPSRIYTTKLNSHKPLQWTPARWITSFTMRLSTPTKTTPAPSSAVSQSAPAAPATSSPPSSTADSPPRVRSPRVTSSAQLRAQRPRGTEKTVSNPDTALNVEKCGPEPQAAPEMVSIVNEATGERLGPRGLEPTRYGDWEAKGRCWDF